MSFFEELKRRNVVRVGIAYAVAAWIILQVTDVVGEIMELPPWGGKLILLLLLIGFVLALILAWAYELTPDGLKRESEVDRSQSIAPTTGKRLNNVILLLLAAAVVYLLVDKFRQPPPAESTQVIASAEPGELAEAGEDRPGTATSDSSSVSIDPRSVAVLPFDNRSQRDDDIFFVQGVHDDLLTNLARIDDLQVISRTSVLQFKDTEQSIPEIAQQLGVATIMEGAVQRSGDTVRVNVQLIDAATDRHLWAETFDRQLTTENLFDIQTEISEQIARALQATLSPAERERIENRPTNDLAAYSAYQRGRQALERRSAEGAETALVEFRRAVELDPEFAAAWAGVAMAANLDFDVSDMDLEEARQISGDAAEKALALNDQLGEVYLAKAQHHDLHFGEAEQEEAALKRAIELSPGDARAHLMLSNHYSRFPNRGDEALTLAEQAARLDPLSDNVQIALVNALIALDQQEVAEQRLLRLIEQNPTFPAYYSTLAEVTAHLGRLDEAMQWRRQAQALDPGNIRLVLEETWALTSLGMEQELDRLAQRLQAMDPDSSTVAFSAMITAIYRRDLEEGLAQATRYGELLPQQRGQSFMRYFLMTGQAEEARSAMAGGPFDDPDQWPALIPRLTSLGCQFAWALSATGDVEAARSLAGSVYDYFEKEVPLGASSWDLWNLMFCDVVVADPDQLLDRLDRVIAMDGFSGWWQTMEHPALAPLREDPRFMAAQTTIRQTMQQQRENLQQLWATEASP